VVVENLRDKSFAGGSVVNLRSVFSYSITDVLGVFYLPIETRVNAKNFLRQSFETKLRRTVNIAGRKLNEVRNFPSTFYRGL
jgi:hypothetical protein